LTVSRQRRPHSTASDTDTDALRAICAKAQ